MLRFLPSVILRDVVKKMDQFQKICDDLDLGKIVTEPVLCKSKTMHLNEVWQVKTNKGIYAIKQMRPNPIRTRQLYDIVEQLTGELALIHPEVITAYKLPSTTNAVIELERRFFLAYPWVDGEFLDFSEVKSQHVSTIAKLLAGMHNYPFKLPASVDLCSNDLSIEPMRLNNLYKINDQLKWTDTFKKIYTELLQASKKCNQFKLCSDSSKCVFTHTDITPVNVLWSKEGVPTILDWEWACLVDPTVDCIHTALFWSGICNNKFDPSLFDAFISAYLKSGGVINQEKLTEAFYVSLGVWIHWAVFNMEESIQAVDQKKYADEAEKTLGIIGRYLQEIPSWLSIIMKSFH